MTGDLIQANYEALAALAATFGQENARIRRVQQTVTGHVDVLRAGWLGDNATAFVRSMEGDVQPAITRLAEAYATAATVVREIATLMQAAEEEAAAQLKDGATGDSGAPLTSFSAGAPSGGNGAGAPANPHPIGDVIRPAVDGAVDQAEGDVATRAGDALGVSAGASANNPIADVTRPAVDVAVRELENDGPAGAGASAGNPIADVTRPAVDVAVRQSQPNGLGDVVSPAVETGVTTLEGRPTGVGGVGEAPQPGAGAPANPTPGASGRVGSNPIGDIAAPAVDIAVGQAQGDLATRAGDAASQLPNETGAGAPANRNPIGDVIGPAVEGARRAGE